jgi:hypothetical protein
MTTEQLNRILFWTTIGIIAFSVWLVRSAEKFGEQLGKKEKLEKAAKSAKKIKPSKTKAAQ